VLIAARRGLLAAGTAVALLLPAGAAGALTAPSPEPLPTSSQATLPPESTGPASPPLTPSPTPAEPMPAISPRTPRASDGPTTKPEPPDDGVVPSDGRVDEYLALSSEREVVVDSLAAARTSLARAEEELLARAGAARTAALRASVARMSRQQIVADVDDVVRQLYQGGDSGLASLAFVVTAGPDHFVERLGNVSAVRAAATAVALRAESAGVAARAAEVARRTATDRVHQAAAQRTRGARAIERLSSRLRGLDRSLARIAAVAPQVAVGPEGCPASDVGGTLRDGAEDLGAARLCRYAVRHAATPQAALAITWAFRHLGAAYACGGAGRLLAFRADCSSLLSRAYAEGAGLRTAGDGWAPSTRDMVPWDGVALDPHYAYLAPGALRPGDLVLYDTCPQGGCPYKHVVMYLGDPDGGPGWMLHTNSCGDVAKVERFWGTGSTASRTFLVARRVLALPGETVSAPARPTTSRGR